MSHRFPSDFYEFGVTSYEPGKFTIALSKSVVWLSLLRFVLTVLVIAYTVSIIVSYAEKKDDESRKTITFANHVLLGSNGTLMMLFWLWITTFIVIAMLPLILHVLHRIGVVRKAE